MIIKIIAKIMMIMMILTVAAKVGRSVVRYIDYSETLLWIISILLMMTMMMIVAMSIFIVILSLMMNRMVVRKALCHFFLTMSLPR